MTDEKLTVIISKMFDVLIDSNLTYGECKLVLQQVNLHLEDKVKNLILVKSVPE